MCQGREGVGWGGSDCHQALSLFWSDGMFWNVRGDGCTTLRMYLTLCVVLFKMIATVRWCFATRSHLEEGGGKHD